MGKPKALQNKSAEAARDEKGRLLPGHTANPGGRPKEAKEVVNALRLQGDVFVAKILELCEQGNVEALKLGMAYAYGKPTQTIKHGADGDVNLFQLVMASMKRPPKSK